MPANLFRAVRAFAAQLNISPRQETVSSFASQYLEWRTRGLKDRTVRCLRNSARHVTDVLGPKAIAELTREDGELLMRVVSERHPDGSGGESAANAALAFVQAFYNESIAKGLAPEPNPFVGVRRYSRLSEGRVLSPRELELFGLHLRECALRGRIKEASCAAIQVAMLSGMREQEVCRLEWVEVSRSSQLLSLRKSKTGPKLVPIGRACHELILSQPQRGRWVFPSPKNVVRPICGLYEPIRRVCKLAKIDGVSPHTFRHTWATRAAEMGVPVAHIQAVLGHSSIAVTDRYVHASARAAVSTADDVAESLCAEFLGSTSARKSG